MIQMAINAYANTTMGSLPRNDDAYVILDIHEYVIIAVVDGNGGKEAMINTGAIATSVIRDYFQRTITPKTSIQEMESSIRNLMFLLSRVYLTVNAMNEQYVDINASLALAAIQKTSLSACLCSIGSAEIEIIQNAQYRRLTQLYTEAYNLLDKGQIPPEELYTHPKRAILTSSLGVFDDFTYDIQRIRLLKDDILLLLTDGVYRVTTPGGVVETLGEAMQEKNDIKYCVDKVLDKAYSYQCDDNATLALIYIPDDNGATEVMKSEQKLHAPISSIRNQNMPSNPQGKNEIPRNNFFTPKSQVEQSRKSLFEDKNKAPIDEYNPYGL